MKGVVFTNNYVPITTISEFAEASKEILLNNIGAISNEETIYNVRHAFNHLFMQGYSTGLFNELLHTKVTLAVVGFRHEVREVEGRYPILVPIPIHEPTGLTIDIFNKNGVIVDDLAPYVKIQSLKPFNIEGSWAV